MYYEINVSLNGKHFFATAERSIRTEEDLKNKLKVFMKKFPASEGYKINVSYWEKYGKELKIDKLLKIED